MAKMSSKNVTSTSKPNSKKRCSSSKPYDGDSDSEYKYKDKMKKKFVKRVLKIILPKDTTTHEYQATYNSALEDLLLHRLLEMTEKRVKDILKDVQEKIEEERKRRSIGQDEYKKNKEKRRRAASYPENLFRNPQSGGEEKTGERRNSTSLGRDKHEKDKGKRRQVTSRSENLTGKKKGQTQMKEAAPESNVMNDNMKMDELTARARAIRSLLAAEENDALGKHSRVVKKSKQETSVSLTSSLDEYTWNLLEADDYQPNATANKDKLSDDGNVGTFGVKTHSKSNRVVYLAGENDAKRPEKNRKILKNTNEANKRDVYRVHKYNREFLL